MLKSKVVLNLRSDWKVLQLAIRAVLEMGEQMWVSCPQREVKETLCHSVLTVEIEHWPAEMNEQMEPRDSVEVGKSVGRKHLFLRCFVASVLSSMEQLHRRRQYRCELFGVPKRDHRPGSVAENQQAVGAEQCRSLIKD